MASLILSRCSMNCFIEFYVSHFNRSCYLSHSRSRSVWTIMVLFTHDVKLCHKDQRNPPPPTKTVWQMLRVKVCSHRVTSVDVWHLWTFWQAPWRTEWVVHTFCRQRIEIRNGTTRCERTLRNHMRAISFPRLLSVNVSIRAELWVLWW